MIFAYLAEVCTFKPEILSHRKYMTKLPHLGQIAKMEKSEGIL